MNMDAPVQRPPDRARPPKIPERKRFSSPIIEAAGKLARLIKDKGKEWVAKTELLTRNVRENVQMARAFDRDFFSQRSTTNEDLAQHVERMKTVEALSVSGEMEKKSIGDVSVNPTTLRRYEGPPPKTAYVKTTHGETYYSDQGKAMRWDADALEHRPTDSITVADDVRSFTRVLASAPLTADLKKALGKKYGISPEDVPVDPKKNELRVGFPAGTSAIREYAVSRLDMLLGADVVPITVLREDGDDPTDLCSVQEAVASKRKDFPVRELYKQEVDILFEMEPDQWAARLKERFRNHAQEERVSASEEVEDLSDFAELEEEGEPQKSLMRIACMDYLVGSMDRHYGNLLYDPVSMKFHAIDNGLSFGMATDVSDPSLDMLASTKAVRSIPLEIIGKNTNLQLDGEMRKQLEGLLNAIRSNGPEASLTTTLFKMLFPKQEIARVEESLFIKKIEALVEHGRPPRAEITPHLFPVGLLARELVQEDAMSVPEAQRKSATPMVGKKHEAI